MKVRIDRRMERRANEERVGVRVSITRFFCLKRSQRREERVKDVLGFGVKKGPKRGFRFERGERV